MVRETWKGGRGILGIKKGQYRDKEVTQKRIE